MLRAVRVEIRVEQRCISLDEYECGGAALVPAGECDTSEAALAAMSLADQISRPEIAAAVRALPPREQEILDLAFRHGLTDAEIGKDGASPQKPSRSSGSAHCQRSGSKSPSARDGRRSRPGAASNRGRPERPARGARGARAGMPAWNIPRLPVV